ncbi:hypothetical protein [Kushneria konosiri]|uniref:Uncharacterized protein n=1 Tax=Kushneria konosiri TaxID=698828 RepID=A0A2Z2H301_9GAMM|nr:hypothetical protein [Kushneria konosiri]ARS51494.1 hypothetical protein B9G99_00085 [Kushneria konosiri]
MATNTGNITTYTNRLGEQVRFWDEVILGGPEMDATLDGKSRPSLAKLVASYMPNFALHDDLAAGLSATGEGAFFSVLSEIEQEFVILYQVVNGQAEEVKRYPSIKLFEAALAARDRAERAALATEQDAYQAGLSAGRSEAFAKESRITSEASGNVLFFDTRADALAANLEEGQVVEIFRDEEHYGRNTRNRQEGDTLVYKQRGALYSDQPGIFHSKTISEAPIWPRNSNGLLIGPVIYIEEGVVAEVPEGTIITVTAGTEFNTNG